MKIQLGTTLGLVALVLVVGYIGYSEFPTQQATAQGGNENTFKFAQAFVNRLDAAQYQDGSPIIYTGETPQSITIREWADVKLVDKNLIRTEANLAGYEEIP